MNWRYFLIFLTTYQISNTWIGPSTDEHFVDFAAISIGRSCTVVQRRPSLSITWVDRFWKLLQNVLHHVNVAHYGRLKVKRSIDQHLINTNCKGALLCAVASCRGGPLRECSLSWSPDPAEDWSDHRERRRRELSECDSSSAAPSPRCTPASRSHSRRPLARQRPFHGFALRVLQWRRPQASPGCSLRSTGGDSPRWPPCL